MYDVNDIVENYINCSEGVKKVTVQYLRTITGCENEDNRELLFNTALYLRNNNYFIVVKKDYLICYVDPEERFKFENRLKGFSLLYSLLIGVLLSVVAFSLYYQRGYLPLSESHQEVDLCKSYLSLKIKVIH